MGKKEKTPFKINETEYFVEDLNDEQRMDYNHWQDLDRKISSIQFNFNQLLVGRQAFIDRLASSLKTPLPTEDSQEADG
jgi:hypothetical protein